MREASMVDITKFLECRRVAMVGVSRDQRHFSRLVMREFLNAGYDAIPVNPQATEIEDRRCFARLGEVTPPVEAALLLTGASDTTYQAIRECHKSNIRNIWIYKSLHNRPDHERELEQGRSQRLATIEGYCPLMFLPRPKIVHRAHRFFMKVAGQYPL
jgi:predicted CoA-binding protein